MKIRSRFLPLILPALLALLSACGGGGGGGVATGGVLRILTDWSGSANPGGGLSEQLDLYDANGKIVQTLEIDKTSPSVQANNFATHPAGTYRLHGQLKSALGFTGVLTGELDTVVVLSPGALVQIDVGTVPTSVVVTPTSADFQVQFSQRFYAAGGNGAAGHITYMQPSSVAWSDLGGKTTTGTTSGIAIGAASGSGFVRATYSPTLPPGPSQIGSAAVNIADFTPVSNAWTVFVYINAANNLMPFSKPNVVQMQKVAGVSANVRFVVQWKESADNNGGSTPDFVGTRRYLITPSNGNSIVSTVVQDLGTDVDMGSPDTLAAFLAWGTANFPSTRTCVVCWDHGNGWAPGRFLRRVKPTRGWSYDDDTGNFISADQFLQSLGTVQPDILAWDCCNMQMIEVAYEGRNVVKYMVGNEAATPAPGYPYDLIFANFRDNPSDTTANLCKSFCDGMVNFYGASSSVNEVTQSVFDESKMSALASAVGDLGTSMVANAGSLNTLVPWIRTHTGNYDDDLTVGRQYRDLYEVCNLLINGGGGANPGPAPAAVQTAAAAVQTAITDCVIYKRRDNSFPQSHGVAISFYNHTNYASVSADYTDLAFSTDDPGWSNWLGNAGNN